jgi:vacuolar-type H+-ATPase subunit D/Vma8
VARLSLPATKGNLLKIKAEQLLAIEAVTFLEEKRDLLLGEMLRLQGQAATFRRRVEQALTGAYGHLVDSLLAEGREAVARAALGVKGQDRVDLKDRWNFTPGTSGPTSVLGPRSAPWTSARRP